MQAPAPGPTATRQPPELLITGQVAALLHIDVKTVTRRADAGILPAYRRTLGGYRRWLAAPVRALAAGHITAEECTELMLAGRAR